MRIHRGIVRLFVLGGFLSVLPALWSHPAPDIPVRAHFYPDGKATFEVELDPRAFAEDPEAEPYLLNWVYEEMTADEREALFEEARTYLSRAIEIRFAPGGPSEPDYDFRFTTHKAGPLEAKDTPVVLTGQWDLELPEGIQNYQLEAKPGGELSVLFLNHVGDEPLQRMQVLFPGESSKPLDLSQLAEGAPNLERKPEGAGDPEGDPDSASDAEADGESAAAGDAGDETQAQEASAMNGVILIGAFLVVGATVAVLFATRRAASS